MQERHIFITFSANCLLDKAVAGHFLGLLNTKDVENRWSHISKTAVLYLGILVGCYIYERYRIQRVGCVWSAIGIDCIVGITVVGNDDYLVIIGLCSLSTATTAFSIAS